MKFELTILGSNSASPAYGRKPTAQYLKHSGSAYLIDCGEGTQFRLQDYGLKASLIDSIFISHLHGDHFFGLPGLLSSYSLAGRSKPLTLFSPPGLEKALTSLFAAGAHHITYPLIYHVIEASGGTILKNEYIKVEAFPLKHKIPTFGYQFTRKEPSKMDKSKLEAHLSTGAQIAELMKNGFVEVAGRRFDKTEFELCPPKEAKYAFCSDTAFHQDLANHITDCDLLYHETTFLKDCENLAASTFHSTTVQAAQIATMANAKKLIIGHFSARYADTRPFLSEVSALFPHVELATEGTTFII